MDYAAEARFVATLTDKALTAYAGKVAGQLGRFESVVAWYESRGFVSSVPQAEQYAAEARARLEIVVNEFARRQFANMVEMATV